jgi:N-acetylglucosamine transport system permease protein
MIQKGRVARTGSMKASEAVRVLVHVLVYALLIAWCAFSIFSLVWVISTSFKTNKELYDSVWGLPKALRLENYIKAWDSVNIRRFFFNSLFVTLTSILLSVLLCTPAAHVLSRVRFRGRNALRLYFLVGIGLPFHLLIVPLFKMFATVHLNDRLLTMIVIYVSLVTPFTVFLLSGFLKSIPSQLEEAARIDGCSPFGAFWRIVFPLAQPGILTASIFNFVFIWNEFLMAYVFLISERNYTVSLGLLTLQSATQMTGDFVTLFASIVIVMLPTFAMFIILSEKMITGITLGAVKG